MCGIVPIIYVDVVCSDVLSRRLWYCHSMRWSRHVWLCGTWFMSSNGASSDGVACVQQAVVRVGGQSPKSGMPVWLARLCHTVTLVLGCGAYFAPQLIRAGRCWLLYVSGPARGPPYRCKSAGISCAVRWASSASCGFVSWPLLLEVGACKPLIASELLACRASCNYKYTSITGVFCSCVRLCFLLGAPTMLRRFPGVSLGE